MLKHERRGRFCEAQRAQPAGGMVYLEAVIKAGENAVNAAVRVITKPEKLKEGKMDNETIKQKLLSLGVPAGDFTVTLTGKSSKKVNGIYKPETKEILIYNKNFTNSNSMMYTAIHEFTHHVCTGRKLVKSVTGHSTVFWAMFHSIVDIAVEKGVYIDPFTTDVDLQSEGKKVLDIIKEQNETMHRLGLEIHTMQAVCTEKGARIEDFIDRHARITKRAADTAIKSQLELFNLKEFSPQMIDTIAGCPEGEKRDEAVARAEDGQTIDQIRAIVKRGKDINPTKVPESDPVQKEDILDRLITERERIKKTIDMLTMHMQEVDINIEKLRKELPHLEFDSDNDDEEKEKK